MLQRAANNAYSWWWVSHIRTKQSKWLEQNLEDMEDKVGAVLKLIEEDGDSFRKRAEMYYKKRPELISFVEESYRAYRALAERYDHLSKDLQNANHTIATVFPDRVHFGGVEYDDDEAFSTPGGLRKRPLEVFRPESPRDLKLPAADLRGLVRATTKKFEGKSLSNVAAAAGSGGAGRVAAASSGLSKQEGMQEIDRLQRRILSLQTEKEYVTNMYETSLSKYWELEKEMEELQERVSGLQDEFGAGTVIEDDEARKLMAETALRSCRETLSELQEKQDKSAMEAKLGSRRIEDARGKLDSFKDELVPNEAVRTEEESNVSVHEAVSASEARNLEFLKAKIKEHFEVEFGGSLSVSQMADKIDELVSKVMSLETAVSSQTVQIQSLQTETDDLHSQIRALEDKATLLDNKNELREQLEKMEGKWCELQSLNRSIEEENYNLQAHLTEAKCNLEHLSEKLHIVQPDEEPEGKGKLEKSSVFETNPNVVLNNLKSMKPDEKHEEASLEQQGIDDKLSSVQTVEEPFDKHDSVQTAKATADKHTSLQTAESAEERSLEQQEINNKLASEQAAEEYADKHASVQTVKETDDNQASEQTAEETSLEQQEIDDKLASIQTAEEIADEHASVRTTEETSDKRASGQAAEQTSDMHALLETVDSLHKVEEHSDAPVETSRNENEAIDYRQQMDDNQVSSSTEDEYPKFNQEESVALRRENGDEMGCTSNETVGSLEQQLTTEKLASTETDDNVPHAGLQESAVGREDGPDWRQLFLNGMNDREKVLLSEYAAVLRDYNETKKMLSELEARYQTSLLEITVQLNNAKKDNSSKEEEILRLRRKLKLLEEELSQRSRCICQNLINKQPSESTAACIATKAMEDEEEMAIPFVRPQTSSPLEEKFRTSIDKLLEENLNFWLKFSTSFSLIQKFETEVTDLRGEVSNLKARHNQEGSSRSKYSLKTDVRPTYRHLSEVQTELALWLEKNVLLKDELRQRSASLRNMQDEIMKALKQSAEDDEFTFTSYQVAKFQGEILNMKQENKRVAEELQAGLDHVKALLIEVERNLAKMGEEFGLSGSRGSSRFQDGVTRSRIPLRTFLFGAKEKKRSVFSFVHPALYRKNTTRRW